MCSGRFYTLSMFCPNAHQNEDAHVYEFFEFSAETMSFCQVKWTEVSKEGFVYKILEEK